MADHVISVLGERHDTARLEERNYLPTLHRKGKQARLLKVPGHHIGFFARGNNLLVYSLRGSRDQGQAYYNEAYIVVSNLINQICEEMDLAVFFMRRTEMRGADLCRQLCPSLGSALDDAWQVQYFKCTWL